MATDRDTEVSYACDVFDLESYLVEHGFQEGSNAQWMGYCPNCGKVKISVNSDLRQWHCWVCQEYDYRWFNNIYKRVPIQGAGGVIKLIAWVENISLNEAAERVLREAESHNKLTELSGFSRILNNLESKPQPVWKGFIDPPEGSSPITKGLPYMEKRGITLEDVAPFGLFYTLNIGKYKNRLVFPVWEGENLVYWQARSMEDPVPGERYIKCLNPPKEPGAPVSTDVLMNIDTATKFDTVIIVEGPMDLIKVGPDAVCTFGKHITNTQVTKLLTRGVKNVILMWDADAKKDMDNVAPWLASLFNLKLVYLPSGDPGERTREENRSYINKAIPFVGGMRL